MNKIGNTLARADQRIAKFQFLSGNMVKLIAVICMFIDHFTKVILNGRILRCITWGGITAFRFRLMRIGSIAFPLFSFLLTEGFCHTRSRKRYALSLAVFALISEIPFDLCFFNMIAESCGTFPFFWEYQNVFFTLLLGLGALCCIEKFRCQSDEKKERIKSFCLQAGSVAIMAVIAELIRSDYGAHGVLFIVVLYISRKNRVCQVISFLLVYVILENSLMTAQLVICLIILLYNGERGKMPIPKYICYVFYPAHALILYGISLLLHI